MSITEETIKLDNFIHNMQEVKNYLGAPPPPSTTLVYPERKYLIQTAGYPVLYNVPTYSNGKFNLPLWEGGIAKYNTSPTGLKNTWTKEAFQKNIAIPNGTVRTIENLIQVNNMWYGTLHWWDDEGCHQSFFTSPNKINWTPVTINYNGQLIAYLTSGEDSHLHYNALTNEFYYYVRPEHPSHGAMRRVAFMKSADFINWSTMYDILVPDAIDFPYVFYAMTVLQNGSDWWGFVYALRLSDNGIDRGIEPTPNNRPFDPLEQTIETRLVYSTNGINWTWCNNREPFMPRPAGVFMIMGFPVIINDKLIFYTLEGYMRHTGDAENQDKTIDTGRWEMNLSDLDGWKPTDNSAEVLPHGIDFDNLVKPYKNKAYDKE